MRTRWTRQGTIRRWRSRAAGGWTTGGGLISYKANDQLIPPWTYSPRSANLTLDAVANSMKIR